MPATLSLGDHAHRPLISVVDDDAAIRASLSDLLDSAGCQSKAFSSSEEFLGSDVVFASDVIITDIQMAGLDGLTLLQHLHQGLGSKVPVIVITALTDEKLRSRAAACGCFAFLRKPVEADTLLRLINEAITS